MLSSTVVSSLTVVVMSGCEYNSGRAAEDTGISGEVDVSPGEVASNVLVVTSRDDTGSPLVVISTRKAFSALGADGTMVAVCSGDVTSHVLVVNSVVAASPGDDLSSVRTVDADIAVSLRDVVVSGSVPSVEVVSSAVVVISADVGSYNSVGVGSDSSVKKGRTTPHT